MLVVEETKTTPRIYFNSQEDIYEITGKCYPENVIGFIAPALDWIDSWAISNAVSLKIELIYISSAATIAIIKLLKRIAQKEGSALVTVNWCYESDDDEAKNMGESIRSLVDLQFNIQEVV